MKSIILTAQEARDFDKKKAITVEKPIKQDSAAPYTVGEAVYIREPWKRLTAPDGQPTDSFSFASNAVSGPDTSNCFKWASPVSMPAAAIRYYGRIEKIVEVNGTAEVKWWEITLGKISKSDAEFAEAGVSVSDAADEEGVSEPYVYKGDMNPEDFKAMQEATFGESPDNRLEKIRRRRQELEEFISGKILSDEADKAVKAEFAALNAEEIAIMKAAGLYQGFDYSILEQTEKTELPEESPQNEQPAAEQPGAETPEQQSNPPEDKPTGYNIGTCPFCGRKWNVILAGAPNGEYSTQEEANAAAGRGCECEGSKKHYATVGGADWAITTGTCKYCGQLLAVGDGYYSQHYANEAAEQLCKCPEASRERRIIKNISDGRDRIQQLFGENAPALGFKPIDVIEPIDLLKEAVELVARHQISGLAISIRGYCKAKIGLTSKDKIKVERSEAHTCQLEAGG